jgi:hypothetical protein
MAEVIFLNGSEVPDTCQNVMDPEHCYLGPCLTQFQNIVSIEVVSDRGLLTENYNIIKYIFVLLRPTANKIPSTRSRTPLIFDLKKAKN